MKTYRGIPKKSKNNYIYLYGANWEFKHGKGSALYAVKEWGAIYGKGGFQGNSYAIITKDLKKRKHPSVSKEFIIKQIKEFYEFASKRDDLLFFVAYSGTGTNLNGYSCSEMAEMFSSELTTPNNIVFEEKFSTLLKFKNG